MTAGRRSAAGWLIVLAAAGGIAGNVEEAATAAYMRSTKERRPKPAMGSAETSNAHGYVRVDGHLM